MSTQFCIVEQTRHTTFHTSLKEICLPITISLSPIDKFIAIFTLEYWLILHFMRETVQSSGVKGPKWVASVNTILSDIIISFPQIRIK